jgi:NADPH-dependent F420 reductase
MAVDSAPAEIGILGGTGDLGRGIALRWAARHSLLIGSRDAERGRAAASELRERLGGPAGSPGIRGGSNEEAAAAPIVLVALPPESCADTVGAVAGSVRPGAIVISAVVPLKVDQGVFSLEPAMLGPGASSAAEAISRLLPRARVVAALHTLPARALAKTSTPIEADVLVCGDDPQAVSRVRVLCDEIDGVRALAAGPLGAAPALEGLLPAMLNASTRNGIRQPVLRLSDARRTPPDSGGE